MSALKRHATTAATILVAVVWFLVLRPSGLGGPATYVIVHGVSMTGTLASGDLVVTSAQDHYSVGDIVAYRIPSGPGKGDMVIHRIIKVDAAGYVTQGDANPSPDPWHPANSDVAGKMAVRVPGVGQIVTATRSPVAFGVLWAVVAFVLVLAFVHGPKVWKYSKAVVLDHWPLGGSELPTWVTKTIYRTKVGPSGSKACQVWSRRDNAWLDLLAFENDAGKTIWFGDGEIEFGDPMVVDVPEAEVGALIGETGK